MAEGSAEDSSNANAVRRAGFSDAFEKLITGPNDIEGMLAYVLYKREKRAFIINNDLSIDDSRVKNYHNDLHDERIESLKARANRILSLFSDRVIEALTSDEIQQAVETALYKQIRADIKSGTRLWKSIAAGVASSVVVALVLTAAKLIDWTNPLYAFQPKSPPSSTVSPAKSPGAAALSPPPGPRSP